MPHALAGTSRESRVEIIRPLEKEEEKSGGQRPPSLCKS
jgi:hypothetical protein